MKILSFAIASLLTVASFSAVSAQPKGSAIDFTEKVHDFGSVVQRPEPLKHTFTFKNTGDAPLELKEVKASCGCTAPTWSKEKIAPGAEGKIEVAYNNSNIVGGINKSITVITNESFLVKENGVDVKKEGKTHTLFIKGAVVAKPDATPTKQGSESPLAPKG